MFDIKKKARLRAIHVLARMDRTEAELRRILLKGEYAPEVVEDAIAYVKSFGYIDDERYLTKYVEAHKSERSWNRMRYDLIRKGIASDLLQAAKLSLDSEEERRAILRLLHKKWKSMEKPNEKELRKIFAYLARQGFKSHDIWGVLYAALKGKNNSHK